MIRIALLALSLIALGWAAAWLAERPGAVSLVWQGWRIDTSVPIALLAALLAAAALWGIGRFLRWLLAGPGAWRRSRRERGRRRGFDALTQGMVAIAAGDGREAERQAGRARNYLGEAPLGLLLAAQAAQLEGDAATARQRFEALAAAPSTAVLGLRGLLGLARREDDRARALALVERIHALRPEAAWAMEELFQLKVEAGDWAGAERALAEAQKRKAMGERELVRRRAIVLFCEAREADARGEEKRALELARKVHGLLPGFVPATALAARLAAAGGDRRKARKLAEDGWRHGPHPELAAVWQELLREETPANALAAARRLAASEAGHGESRLLVAEAALAADVRDEARAVLDDLLQADPSPRAWRLMADLREREGDAAAARAALAEAVAAPPDAAWCCTRCGFRDLAWQPHCQGCGTFDGYDWRRPAGVVRLPARPPAEPIAPPPALLPAYAREAGSTGH